MVGEQFSDLFRSQDWSQFAGKRDPVAFLTLGGSVNHIKTVHFTTEFYFL